MKKNKDIKILISTNKKIIYSGIIGIGIGTLITLSFYPERIAKLENGEEIVVTTDTSTITANKLYEDMKEEHSITTLLNTLDSEILSTMYTITDDMNNEIEDTLEYYLNAYKSYYNYTEEDFLTSNGFTSKEDFKNYLTTDYLRNLYYEEYAKEQITDKEIKNYYKKSVYGAINTNYIAIKTTEENAEDLVKEILDKLNNGSTYDNIIEEYKDKINYANLGYQIWNSTIDSKYMDALKELKDNTYSKEYVITDFGYTIIFRLDQKDKNTLENEKDNIREKLAQDLMDSDENLFYKSLINLRENYNIDFKDTDLNKKYKVYCNQFK